MAQPRLKAKYFITLDGIIIIRARELTETERRKIFLKDRGVCCLCGQKVDWAIGNSVNPLSDKLNAHVDHIIPRSRGGQNNRKNLRLLCVSCNTQKGAR